RTTPFPENIWEIGQDCEPPTRTGRSKFPAGRPRIQQNVMAVTYRRPAVWKGPDQGELAAPTTPPSPRVVRIRRRVSISPRLGGALYLWRREWAAGLTLSLWHCSAPQKNRRLDSVLGLRSGLYALIGHRSRAARIVFVSQVPRESFSARA